jgi:hypothetical protein
MPRGTIWRQKLTNPMETEYGSWTAADRDLRISYSRAAMESLRRAATAGLKQVPADGLEIGGVLFGRRDAGQIVVEDWREIGREHSEGHRLDLSLTRAAFLNSMLSLAVADPGLSELEIVGWFRTRTKGAVILSASDVAFFDRQFPELWQVVLVIRPYVDEPARAGFFFRDETGKLQAGASLQEFRLENWRTKLPFHIDYRQLPADPKPPVRLSARAAAIIAVTIALLVVLAVPGLPTRGSGADAPPDLHVNDVDGQLVIEWNGLALPVLPGTSATLKIFDGPEERIATLTPGDLRGGCLVYQRRTGEVAMALLVPTGEGNDLSAIARFSGDSPPPTRVSALGAGTEDLQEQVRSLRAQLRTETERSRTLRNAVNAERAKPGVGPPEQVANDR